jgi:hypothetical protein
MPLLDGTGRWFAGQARPSPPKATVVVGCAQPYQPAKTTSSLAHTAGLVIAGAVSSPPHIPDQPVPDQFPLQPTPPD